MPNAELDDEGDDDDDAEDGGLHACWVCEKHRAFSSSVRNLSSVSCNDGRFAGSVAQHWHMSSAMPCDATRCDATRFSTECENTRRPVRCQRGVAVGTVR